MRKIAIVTIVLFCVIYAEINAKAERKISLLQGKININSQGTLDENPEQIGAELKRKYKQESIWFYKYGIINLVQYWEGEDVMISIALRNNSFGYDSKEYKLINRERWLKGIRLIIIDMNTNKVVGEKILGKDEEYMGRLFPGFLSMVRGVRDKKCDKYTIKPQMEVWNAIPLELKTVIGKIEVDHLYKIEVKIGKEFRDGIAPRPIGILGFSGEEYIYYRRPVNEKEKGIQLTHLGYRKFYSEPAEAEKLFLEALEKDITLQSARAGLCSLYERQKRTEEMIRIYIDWMDFADEKRKKKIIRKIEKHIQY